MVVVLGSCSLNNSEFRASNSDKWSYGHLWWMVAADLVLIPRTGSVEIWKLGRGKNLWPRGAPTAIHLLFMLLANCTDQLDG